MKAEAEAEYHEFVAARIDRLGRFAFLLCRDWHRAEDAVQKSLTRLYLHWGRTRIDAPDAYVRRIIANVLAEESKRYWFQRERPSRLLPDVPIADPADASADRLTMLDALSRLPAGQRLAVVLRHWEDLSVEQAAQIMNCSTGNVKSQTARGLRTMRELLREPIQMEGSST
jgi:RNA polymerase sigma-70 factor (sigma-E family)